MCSIFATTDLRSSFEGKVSYKNLVLFMDEVASASLNCRSWELRLLRISSTVLLNIVASVETSCELWSPTSHWLRSLGVLF